MKRSNFNYNFVGKFPYAVVLSILLVGVSLMLFFSQGLNYGVDFRGGAEIQVKFSEKQSLAELRATLASGGFDSASVQSIGDISENEYLVKVKAGNKKLNEVTDSITSTFSKKYGDGAEIRKTDIVGPKAGAQLRTSGFQAMAWALLVIMIYIGLRFDFKYSPGAIVALLHDVLIILGVFALTNKEFSLQIVGALLAVIGYSVNDTVVVYDRVREHEDKNPTGNLRDLINTALNETLSRTILTSLTTFLVAGMMFLMGGGIIHDFFFAICLGVIIGTYSSIFVAAPTVLFFDRFVKGKAA